MAPLAKGDVALFAEAGGYVTTVNVPMIATGGKPPGVIQWGSRYFIYQNGRYVETMFWFSHEAPR